MLSTLFDDLQTRFEFQTKNSLYFTNAEGYALTFYMPKNKTALYLNMAVPGLDEDSAACAEDFFQTNFPSYKTIYEMPVFKAVFTDANTTEASQIVDFINQSTEFFKKMDMHPDTCPVCGNKGSDTKVFLNDSYMYAHEFCVDKINVQLNGVYKGTAKSNLLGLLVGAGFAIAASSLWVVLALLKIMPSVSAVLIGIAAAIGFKLFNHRPTLLSKIVFSVFFLLLCAGINFAGDYAYAVYYHKNYSFITTYTDAYNIFNTAFDLLSGTIIAYFSMFIVYDMDKGWFRLKKAE